MMILVIILTVLIAVFLIMVIAALINVAGDKDDEMERRINDQTEKELMERDKWKK